MFVERVEVAGLRGLGPEPLELGRVERLRAPWAVQRALHDALLLPFCVADAEVLRELAASWGCENLELHGDPLIEGVNWSGGEGLRSLVAADAEGLVRARVRLRLDPPQFAELRSAALRDPRLVDALAGGPTLELAVGLRFAPHFDAAGVDLLAVTIGGCPFPTSGPDRPAWLVPLLAGLRGRVRAAPLAPAAWGAAAATWSAEAQLRLRDTLSTLAARPAELEGLVPLPGEPALLDGDRLVPLRFFAPESRAIIGWVGAARLARPDVLITMGAPEGAGWSAWWSAQVEAEGAPLEQVIRLGAERGRRVGP